ncbi:MAG TPA: DNA polymerase III subunit delta [Salinimicrobium sp.]|nr:DNA polymerase III subunit delta [Salinimicrobium sp.]
MNEVNQIIGSIKKGQIKPIYFLMGDEAYFIDQISNYIEKNVLSEEEKGFNQMTLYGRDTNIEEIVSHSRRYPMMAERQVIIIKEAQDLSRTINAAEPDKGKSTLLEYVENPQPTTLLVFCYKYKSLDKRKKITKVIQKSGVLFESKKLYEDKIPKWIESFLKDEGFGISPKAAEMLVEFLGNDLGKITNELEKLQLICPKGTQITPEIIEENIGISKDFNNFELRKAIGEKNVVKAHRIVNYFAQNPKENPVVVTMALLFGLFTQLLQYHSLNDKSRDNIVRALKINAYFANDYVTAARNYPMKKVSQVIGLIREADLKSKGVGGNISQGDLLKELLVKIMT